MFLFLCFYFQDPDFRRLFHAHWENKEKVLNFRLLRNINECACDFSLVAHLSNEK
jgi:hypothetical protein